MTYGNPCFLFRQREPAPQRRPQLRRRRRRDSTAARVVAETLLGEPNALATWTATDLTSAPAAFVHGLPVGR